MKAISMFRAARALGLAAALAVAGAAFAQTAPGQVDKMRHGVVTVTTQPSNASLKVSGDVKISTRIAVEEATGLKKLIVVFDFTTVTAKRGPVTYSTTYQEEHVQPLAPNHRYEFDFPVTSSRARSITEDTLTATAVFALNVDPTTGAITSGTGVINAE
jgi:uncharacterized lipoprotein YbaY